MSAWHLIFLQSVLKFGVQTYNIKVEDNVDCKILSFPSFSLQNVKTFASSDSLAKVKK